jgi:hypothetical protein
VVTPSPHAYPWAVPLRAGVLDEHGFHDVGHRAPPPPTGTPVLASGSNASPEVVHRKLGPTLRSGFEAPVVFQPVHVPGLGVGHSAHVSRPGYVAAAPFRAPATPPGGSAARPPAPTYALAWFSDAQLARLDDTEPQYRRLPLPPDLEVRTPEEARRVPGVQLYVSRHGLVADQGTPVAFRSQVEIFDWLRARLGCLRTATMADYADPELREQVRVELATGGWTAPSRLEEAAQA